MKKKKFAICIALLISVFTLVGSFACCANGNTGDNNTGDNGQEEGDNSGTEPPETPTIVPKNCEALVEATLSGAISTHSDFMAICYSLEQLNEECISNGYDFFDSENPMQNDYDTAAGGKIRALKPEDFEGKAFVLCAFYRSEDLGQYRIEEAEVTEDKLTLYVRFPNGGSASCAVNYVFLIATVEESSVSSVADLTYVIRYE